MNESYTQTERLTAYEHAALAIGELRMEAVALIPAEMRHVVARRREWLVDELRHRWPALSHPQISKLIGCEQSTVARILQRLRKRKSG